MRNLKRNFRNVLWNLPWNLPRNSLKRNFRNALRNLPRNLPEFAPKFTPKFPVLSWRVEKSCTQISLDLSHRRFHISNQIPHEISPKKFTTHFSRLGSPNRQCKLNSSLYGARPLHGPFSPGAIPSPQHFPFSKPLVLMRPRKPRQMGDRFLYTSSAGRCCPFAVFSASGA